MTEYKFKTIKKQSHQRVKLTLKLHPGLLKLIKAESNHCGLTINCWVNLTLLGAFSHIDPLQDKYLSEGMEENEQNI